MRVLLLTRYGRQAASSRLRSFQYLPYLEAHGMQITAAPLLPDEYVRELYYGRVRPRVVIQGYARRLANILSAARFDLVWAEKELLPWFPAMLELGLFSRRVPLVVDYDDAVFHRYDLHSSMVVRTLLAHKIDAVMRRAQLVIVGNSYLADAARRFGARRVEQLPTVVDTTRYTVVARPAQPTVVVGWIGTPWTARYLTQIAPVAVELTAGGNFRFVAIGARGFDFGTVPIEALPWDEESEVARIQQFDVGVMPIPDEPFERGKCGYKLIQYMACAIPVVASRVGVNATIIEEGVTGYLATNQLEWRNALLGLRADSSLRQRIGAAGRARVEASYSLMVTAPQLEQMLRSVVA